MQSKLDLALWCATAAAMSALAGFAYLVFRPAVFIADAIHRRPRRRRQHQRPIVA